MSSHRRRVRDCQRRARQCKKGGRGAGARGAQGRASRAVPCCGCAKGQGPRAQVVRARQRPGPGPGPEARARVHTAHVGEKLGVDEVALALLAVRPDAPVHVKAPDVQRQVVTPPARNVGLQSIHMGGRTQGHGGAHAHQLSACSCLALIERSQQTKMSSRDGVISIRICVPVKMDPGAMGP